mgnify:CR=1 FL=1
MSFKSLKIEWSYFTFIIIVLSLYFRHIFSNVKDTIIFCVIVADVIPQKDKKSNENMKILINLKLK